MVNQFIVIGRILETPVLKSTTQGVPFVTLKVEAQRTFKSNNTETDIFCPILWRAVAERCVEEIDVGHTVAIKARLQSHKYTKDNATYYNYEIVCEKIDVLI